MHYLTIFALSHVPLVPFLLLLALDGASLAAFALTEAGMTLVALTAPTRPNRFARAFSRVFVKT